MLTLYIILLYILIISIKCKKLPTSVSETYYLGAGNVFSILMSISSFLLMMSLLDISDGNNFQFIAFIASSGLLLVGIAPRYQDYQKTLHYIGAILLLLGSQIFIYIFGNPKSLLIWLIYILFIRSKYSLLICELLCIILMLINF